MGAGIAPVDSWDFYTRVVAEIESKFLGVPAFVEVINLLK